MFVNEAASGFRMDDTGNVFLMAEDNIADAELVKVMLEQAFDGQYKILCVDRFSKIVEALSEGHFQLLILDMHLPDQSGLENLSFLNERFPDLPVVVLTGQDDLELAVKALNEGAQDYLSKNNITPEILARSLRYAKERKLVEVKLKTALEESAYRNTQLESIVKYDHLTNLPNRTYFQDTAERAMFRAKRAGCQLALLFADIDKFKKVNDSYGHVVGDALLQQVAERFSSTIRNSDFLARLGGDEFIVLTDQLLGEQEVYGLVNRIRGEFNKPFSIHGHQILVKPSIGVAYYPDADSIDLLLKHADCAMYQAKTSGASVCFYSDDLAKKFSRHHEVEQNLSLAIKHNEIQCYFQPILNCTDAASIQIESLARWESSTLGYVAPDEFIPIAENTPAINEITCEILKQSSDLYEALVAKKYSVTKIAINLTASQLSSEFFLSLFWQWMEQTSIPYEVVTLELTERQMVENVDQCRQQIDALRSKGVKIALDDFGSGFSSITHLLDMPLDTLKLDRRLIDNIDQNKRNYALVTGIIEMAHLLDMLVVAEGVERQEEYDIVKHLGCDFVQGYLFSKPLSKNQLLKYYSHDNE